MPLSRGLLTRFLAAGIAAVAVGGIVSGCGSGGGGSGLEGAGSDWSTNGGTMSNQRYSTLDEIDTSNVAQLKGVWRTHLNGSGVAAKYSGESQPIVQDGVIYITTGNDDVFAVSVDSGKILWEHKSNISQEISTICCGWLNRGVAIGDGRLYLGQLDGKVVALDPNTGGVIWTRQLVQWQKGQVITGAPLFLDGKIYIGVVGADYGTRGFLEAIDAETGDSVWRAYMVPGPGEPGSETWPQNSPAYLRGGASIWSTPAYDEDLNLLYVTTGNAGNDWFGGDRAGDNLYAASIVAIDKDTGKLKWHFQEVHHDIWDYDSPAAPVLFDVDSNGNTVKGIGAPGKTGWLYLLDRATGEPLYGIDEKPVPQNAEQKTAKTQPFPRNGEFIPHAPPTAKDDRAREEPDHRRGEAAPGRRGAGDVHAAEHEAHADLHAGPAGRQQLGADELQPGHAHVLRLRRRADGRRARRRPRLRGGEELRGHRRDRRYRLQRVAGHADRDRRDRRQRRLAEDLARRVLQRHRHHEGQPRLRRAQQRRPAGVRRPERKPALELPDRRRRERHGVGLRAGREAVRRLPVRGQLADGLRRTATASGCSRWTGRWARRRPRAPAPAPSTPARAVAVAVASRRQATRPRARPSSPTTARAATGSTARAGTAGRT